GVHAHVLMVDHRALAIAVEGNRRAREVDRPAPSIHDHFDATRIVDQRPIERAGGGAERITALETRQCAADGRGRNEWLVALYVQDEVEIAKWCFGNDFRNALGARCMIGRRHDRFETRLGDDVRDLPCVGSDHKSITHTEFGDAAGDDDDEGFATQWQEWLARKPAGAQPCRNHAKDGHGGRYKIRAVESTPELPPCPAVSYDLHTAARATRRKFSRMRFPCSVPMDSGWNCTP